MVRMERLGVGLDLISTWFGPESAALSFILSSHGPR